MMLFESETTQLKNLINHLYELEQNSDIDSVEFTLKSLGYNLIEIQDQGYKVAGTFINKNFNLAINIPHYEILDDILEQLKNECEGYNFFILEDGNSEDNIKSVNLLDIDSPLIDWECIYNEEQFVKLYSNATVELLYLKLEGILKENQTLNLNNIF